jgi:hypothetical protein
VVDTVGEALHVVIRIGGLADSSAIMRKLADNRRILVAAPVYLNRAGRPATPGDFAGHEFLRYGMKLEPWRLRGPKGRNSQPRGGGAIARRQWRYRPRLGAGRPRHHAEVRS